MTTDNANLRFLELERQAIELLSELEKLREETKNYSTAAISMDNAMSQLSSVTENLKELSMRFIEVIKTLHDMETPELLSKLQSLQEEIKVLKNEVQTRQVQSSLETKAHSREMQETMNKFKQEVQIWQVQSSSENQTRSQEIQETICNLIREVQNWQKQSAAQLNTIVDYERRGFISKLFGARPHSREKVL